MKAAEPNYVWRKLAEFILQGQSENDGAGLPELFVRHGVKGTTLEDVISTISAALPDFSGKSLEQLHATLSEHICCIRERDPQDAGMSPIQVRILVGEDAQAGKPGWAFFLIEKGPGQPPASHAVDIYLYSEGKEND